MCTDRDSSPMLRIAGIIPFSATDWPGKLTATAFTQGCPWRCRYCHNPSLQPFDMRPNQAHDDAAGKDEVGNTTAKGATFAQFMSLLRKRRGLLDGAVISGGEPLAQIGLSDAIRALHADGYAVGLHTCGYLPSRLSDLMADSETRPEWIGIDVKGLPDDMPEVIGCTIRAALHAWESLRMVIRAHEEYGIGMEVRTTVWSGSTLEQHLPELESRIAELGHPLVVHYAHDVDDRGYYIGA